jgi:GT2 family glycosyltransferase
MSLGVSILIPTWNGLDLLKQFLPSVIRSAEHYAQSTQSVVEVLVVDDASTDRTPDWLGEVGFRESTPALDAGAVGLRVLANDANKGFGRSCNRGFESASQPLVFLVNNDVETSADCIAPLVEHFSEPSVFAAHTRVVEFETGRECGTGKLGTFAGGFIKVHRSYVPVYAPIAGSEASSKPAPLFSMFASGGSAMFDRQKVLEIGGFDELLAPAYWEDVDLSYRAWKRGFTVLYEPRSFVRHRVSSTMRKMNQRALRRIQQRNRLMFHWINLHDARMMTSNVVWTVILAVTAPIRFQFSFISALASALKRLPAIRERRMQEKRCARTVCTSTWTTRCI